MKKILLLLVLASGSLANAQTTLLTEDCTALTIGNVGTDLTGITPGQGGWLTYVASSASPAGQNTNFQIVDKGAPYGNAIQLTGSSSATGTRWMTKDLSTVWSGRTAGDDIAQVDYDFFTGPATTSVNTMRITLYESSAHTVMLAGMMVLMNTLEVRGLTNYDNSGTVGNYSFGLGASATAPVLLSPNTWYKLGFSYNFTTGEVIWKSGDGVINGFVAGAAAGTDIAEIDILASAGTANAVSSVAAFDNLNVTASSTDTLLAVNTNAITSNSFSVYPNPAKNKVTISNANASISSIEMTDINGRVVKTENFTNLNNAIVNVSDLAQGVYMMKIVSDKGIDTKKIIKE
jgi:Secretion system C-terminal sorting domain